MSMRQQGKMLFQIMLIALAIVSRTSTHIPTEALNSFNAHMRIIGGMPAKEGEFRGQVSLQNFFDSHICAGILIHPNHVITVAHCFQDNFPIVSVMGDDVSVAFYGSDTRQRRAITNFIQHPNFDKETMANDIAVIRVDKAFKTTNTFGPMRRSKRTPPNGAKCHIVGWGYTDPNLAPDEVAPISVDLLKTEVDVLDINFCNGTFSYEDAMRPGMLCAQRITKEGPHDSCSGDSGGLFSCYNKKVVHGVISFGDGCGAANFPGVYTDVSKYNDWIDEIISTDNLPKYIIPKSELVNEKPKSDASLMTFSVFIPLCAVSVAALVSREYHR